MRTLINPAVSIALLTLAALEINAATPKMKNAYEQPNVLIIMCDQLNYKALSCYGGVVNTPNIDRLANEGIKFTNAYCTTPFCSPSRASIVTGLYPHQHGIVHNLKFMQKEGITIEDTTTEKMLFEKGYTTHQYGKWHLESETLPYLPYLPDQYDYGYQYKKRMEISGLTVMKDDGKDWMNHYGLDWPVEVINSMKEKRTYLDSLWRGTSWKDFVIKMGRLRLNPEDWIDDKISKLTINKINESVKDKKPFMLTCSFIWPHDPNFVPDPYYSMFDPKNIVMPECDFLEKRFERSWSRQMVKGYGEEGLREYLRIYYATVKYLDDRVGEIVKALENQGVLENTFILFTADHGDMMGEHGMVWKTNDSFYEEMARIPYIIRYPKALKHGVSNLPVSLVDIKPTVLSVTGYNTNNKTAGVDLIPFLTGEKDPSSARKYSFCEVIEPHPEGKREITNNTRGSFMVRDEKHKLIIYPDGDKYLYDFTTDPHESKNLINDPAYEKEIKELGEALSEWLEETGWKGRKVKI